MPDRRAYSAKWMRNRSRKLWRYIGLYKKLCGCSKCGYDTCARALDFHHVDQSTKISNISDMAASCNSWEKIKAEMEKCVVLCNRCHAEETEQQRKSAKATILEAA